MPKSGKNAVLLARVPDEFEPSSVADIPGVVLSAHVHKDRLPLCTGIMLCRQLNSEQLAKGHPVREWFLLVKWIRPLASKGGVA